MPYPILHPTGPILIIEDDQDDQYILNHIFTEFQIAEHVRYFTYPAKALDYLAECNEQPFLILCDINLPGISGIELKIRINQNPVLHRKAIPFIFFSTSASDLIVKQAYEQLTIQGFFQKNDDFEKLKEDIRSILVYWQRCKHPNSQGI